jgi:hypothetical protein
MKNATLQKTVIGRGQESFSGPTRLELTLERNVAISLIDAYVPLLCTVGNVELL